MKPFVLALSFCAVAFGATAQTQPPAPVLPAASAVRSGGDMLLIPGRELVVAWKMGSPPTQASEQAAGPNGVPPIPGDPNNESWSKKAVPAANFKPVQPGQIGFTLWVEEGRGTTLVATSGQTEPFFYMANLIVRRAGKRLTSPTTICAVRPGAFGVETWPYPVEAIQIVGIGLSPADMCYDHAAKKGYRVGEQPSSLTGQK